MTVTNTLGSTAETTNCLILNGDKLNEAMNTFSPTKLADEERNAYEGANLSISVITEELDIKAPFILPVSPELYISDSCDNSIDTPTAFAITPFDDPTLPNSVVLVRLDRIVALGIDDPRIQIQLAHECMHIWQASRRPRLYKTRAKSRRDRMSSPAEIDADAYAFWSLSRGYEYSYYDLALIADKDMYLKNHKALKKRLSRAMHYELKYISRRIFFKHFLDRRKEDHR